MAKTGRPPRYKLTGLPPASDPSYPIAYWRATRLVALGLLGGCCCRCGFADERALQFDHVDGDGYLERQGGRSNPTGRAVRSVLNGERRRYQILCANCHSIKTSEQREYLAADLR